jgi:RHS repeat-associated protein
MHLNILSRDGDGNRVLQMEADGSQTAFVGAHYEVWLPGPPPPAPSNLWAVYHEQVFIAFVTLGWQPTTAEAGSTFSVYRSATTPVPIDAGHRIASGLTSGSHTDYGGRLGDYYVVTAVNPYGESDPSNTAQAVNVGIDGREEDLDRQVVAGGGEVLSGEEVITKVYFLGGQRVAMRLDGVVYYFHTDHPSASLRTSLGSTSAMSDEEGNAYGEPVRYLPFGEVRSGDLGELPTDHGFTGHKHEADHLGLIFMQARYYVPELGRFVSPDILIPDPADPQSCDRYAYVRNNPIRLVDPTGHAEEPFWKRAWNWAVEQYGSGGSITTRAA